MHKTIISEGRTRQEAVENGLKELNVSKDRVIIKDVEEEKKRSFYSILAPRVVKVELTIKENPKKENIEKRDTRKNIEKKERRPFNQNKEEIEKAAEEVRIFLGKFLKSEVEYDVEIKEFEIYVVIKGENLNYLIGYRGETINNLQIIITSIANKESSSKIRVFLDVGGYKEKREKTLQQLAEKIARTVIKTGKPVALEPMSAYERKVIHAALQGNDKISTYSKGEEPYRKLVIGLSK